MASTASTQRRKRVDSDPPNMKRGPQGSAFLTCDSCQASVIAAVADMHNCEGNASFKEQLAKMREEYAANHKKEEKKPKAVKTAKSPKSPKEPKAGKDPNAPKAPATPFFIFMEEFRKTYKEENGDVKGPEVAKAGGAKWKEMSDEEKKPYLEEYAKRKEEYEMKLAEYKEGKHMKAEETDADVRDGEGEDVKDEKAASTDEAASAEGSDEKPKEPKRRRLAGKVKEEESKEVVEENVLQDDF
eukprot:TRINITY_DN1630_c0_g1_i1.p1 TRINITY_DN1630_c0_g1~~TRINITY_DN1630_c0_g1_i1.p1  ORF type:complete len:243 (+),score=82.16 TRINITY_DN1630_c0_g1_i1:156-884(+)